MGAPPPAYTPPPAQRKGTPPPGATATPANAKPAGNIPKMTYSQVLQMIMRCKKIKKKVSPDFQNLARNRLWLKGAAQAMFDKFGATSNATDLDPFAKKMLDIKVKHITKFFISAVGRAWNQPMTNQTALSSLKKSVGASAGAKRLVEAVAKAGTAGKALQAKARLMIYEWGSANKMDINKYEVYVRGWLLSIALPQAKVIKGGPQLQAFHFKALDAGRPFDYNRLQWT